ncbi:MAG: sigma-70 family RNA polymerase sigma factor [Acidimicrobiia bacterium]|nr:sigma-70 family RNA polymerase sigma factor [Acidimicrobiia bacterium]
MVRLHQDFVYGAILRVVRSPILAEDLTQETFIRAYRGLDEFRGDAQLRTWLYRIGTNLALNAVTRQREAPTDQLPDTAHQSSPETDVELAHLRRHLSETIESLPESLRTPLILREYDGMSYQDIADDLDLPLNTVRTRILRARRALRRELEPWR